MSLYAVLRLLRVGGVRVGRSYRGGFPVAAVGPGVAAVDGAALAFVCGLTSDEFWENRNILWLCPNYVI